MSRLHGSEKVLLNSTVLQILEEKAAKKKPSCNEIFENKVRKYLATASGSPSKANLSKFESAVQKYKLSKAEVFQLINFRPKLPVELNLLIEQIEERLSEEEQDELLETVKKILMEA